MTPYHIKQGAGADSGLFPAAYSLARKVFLPPCGVVIVTQPPQGPAKGATGSGVRRPLKRRQSARNGYSGEDSVETLDSVNRRLVQAPNQSGRLLDGLVQVVTVNHAPKRLPGRILGGGE